MFCLGQLLLPPRANCPISFIKELLSGKKKPITRGESSPAAVPKVGSITVERVMTVVKGCREILDYLPDLENIKAKHMDRQYLFDVVNTLEPTYFKRCLAELSEINRG